MPPAAAAVGAAAFWQTVAVTVIKTILVNVIVGANEIEVDGEIYVAIGYRPAD